MQKISKTKIDISTEDVALYMESLHNGIWEHLAGYSLDDDDEEDEDKDK